MTASKDIIAPKTPLMPDRMLATMMKSAKLALFTQFSVSQRSSPQLRMQLLVRHALMATDVLVVPTRELLQAPMPLTTLCHIVHLELMVKPQILAYQLNLLLAPCVKMATLANSQTVDSSAPQASTVTKMMVLIPLELSGSVQTSPPMKKEVSANPVPLARQELHPRLHALQATTVPTGEPIPPLRDAMLASTAQEVTLLQMRSSAQLEITVLYSLLHLKNAQKALSWKVLVVRLYLTALTAQLVSSVLELALSTLPSLLTPLIPPKKTSAPTITPSLQALMPHSAVTTLSMTFHARLASLSVVSDTTAHEVLMVAPLS